MRLVLHPRVYSDIGEIMERYERVATPQLADEFYAEVRQFMRTLPPLKASNPLITSACRRYFGFQMCGYACFRRKRSAISF
jgi:hypothetical protein